jgi:DNA-binding response OmpR family regulator
MREEANHVYPTSDTVVDGVRVLLVDDDTPAVTVMSLLLQRSGYAVDVAADVSTAREYARDRRYAAAVIDVLLPDGSGDELAYELARHCGLEGRVGLMTGTITQYDLPCLHKPFGRDAMLAMIGGLMSQSVAEPESGAGSVGP